MELLKDYFFCAMTASVMIGLTENLVNERMKVFVRFISGLFIIILLSVPVLNVLIGFTEDLYDIALIDYSLKYEENSRGEGITNEFDSALKASVKEFVHGITGEDTESIEVETLIDNTDLSDIRVIKMTVVIGSPFDVNVLQRALYDRYGIITEIISAE